MTLVSAALLAALAASVTSQAEAGPAAAPKDTCMLPAQFKSLWPARESVRFAPTSLQERAAFRALIPSLVAAAQRTSEPEERHRALAAKAGFTVEVWRHRGQTFWALREARDALRGAGAYVFRTGPAVDALVQAPHAYFDLGTGAIAAELFVCAPEGKRPRALFTNTAHRFRGRPGERRDDPDHPADLAHNGDHLFQLGTDLMVRALPELRVVQLHGFGESGSGRDRHKLTAVVSSGTDLANPYVRGLAARLAVVLGEGVRLYPDQTGRFGGTQNAQSRLLQLYPRARFVHLELSSAVRRELRKAESLEHLAEALFSDADADADAVLK